MRPIPRVLLALLILYLGASVALSGRLVPLGWGLLLIPLAVALGPALGLAFPFPTETRLAFGGGLLIALTLVVAGFRFRERLLGQGAMVGGVALWTFIGLIGLGTAD